MTVQDLTSKDNPLLKKIRLIASGARRAPEQVVVAEGLRVLEEVQCSSFSVEAVVCSEAFGSEPREQELLDRFDENRVRLFRVSDAIYKSISSVQTPQGVIALVNAPEITFAAVPESPNALILCACGLQDPGNLGTLIRTAAAADASLLCTTAGTVSARNPKSIRSSAGAFFRIPIIEHAEFHEFRFYCHRRAIRLYRTDAEEGVLYTQADFTSPCAVMLGNEGSGLTEQTIRDLPSIRIPIAEGVESLNVATAGAILLFEARRQRRLA